MEGQTTSQPPPESNQDDEDPPKVDLPEQLQKIVPATELPPSLNRWNTNEVSTWVEPPHRTQEVQFSHMLGSACVRACTCAHTHTYAHTHMCRVYPGTCTHALTQSHTHTHTLSHTTHTCACTVCIFYTLSVYQHHDMIHACRCQSTLYR